MDLCCAETDRFLELSDINKCIHIPIRHSVTVLQYTYRAGTDVPHLPLSTTSFKAFMISSLSQSDNHVTITPSAKVVDIEIVWLIFMALDVQAV